MTMAHRVNPSAPLPLVTSLTEQLKMKSIITENNWYVVSSITIHNI